MEFWLGFELKINFFVLSFSFSFFFSAGEEEADYAQQQQQQQQQLPNSLASSILPSFVSLATSNMNSSTAAKEVKESEWANISYFIWQPIFFSSLLLWQMRFIRNNELW